MCSRVVFLIFLTIAFGRNGDVIANENFYQSRRKKDDYTFEGRLARASEECSYIARKDDDTHREELIDRIKNEINMRKVVEFFEEREEDKKKSKEFYDQVEREERRKVLESNPPLPPPEDISEFGRRVLPEEQFRNPSRLRHPPRPRRPPRPPRPPHPPHPFIPERPLPPIPFLEDEFFEHDLLKRSPRSKDPSFSEGTFKDHNNCFSRCVFARMELVDYRGFPQESHLRKALEDYIDNRKIRFSKIRRVYECFDEVKKVAIDDNCIFSTKIFKCMRLDEPGTWS